MVLSIEDIDWEKLKQDILRQQSFVDKYKDTCKEMPLGKLSDLTPSGKHRIFGRPARNLEAPGAYKGWTRNPELRARPPDSAEQEDDLWWRKLVDEGKKHGVYVKPSDDKDRMFIVVGMKIRDRSEGAHCASHTNSQKFEAPT